MYNKTISSNKSEASAMEGEIYEKSYKLLSMKKLWNRLIPSNIWDLVV
jgi:hypothetical protein